METNAQTNLLLAAIAICLFVIAMYCLTRLNQEAQASKKPQRLRAGFTALPFATQ